MKDNYPAWARPVDQVAAHYGVDIKEGLSSEQVEAKRTQHGFNELEKQPGTPLWKLVLAQFDDMLVKVCQFVVLFKKLHDYSHT